MVLQFIYLGQCEVGQDDLSLFLDTGKNLEVSGLMEEISHNEVTETKAEYTANLPDYVQENIIRIPSKLSFDQ